MLDFEQNINALEIPNNCQLIIKEDYQKSAELPAPEKRLTEYLLSRECLKDCCQKLGYAFQFDPTGSDKKVILSPNLIHSLSHSRQVAVALVGPKADYQTCGVDLECKNRPLSDKFINRITTPLERKFLENYPHKKQLLATLIFSAKEAVYKAYSQQIDRFSYQNIEIWEEQGKLKAIIINQQETLPILSLSYGFYKQTHLVTCLIIPKY